MKFMRFLVLAVLLAPVFFVAGSSATPLNPALQLLRAQLLDPSNPLLAAGRTTDQIEAVIEDQAIANLYERFGKAWDLVENSNYFTGEAKLFHPRIKLPEPEKTTFPQMEQYIEAVDAAKKSRDELLPVLEKMPEACRSSLASELWGIYEGSYIFYIKFLSPEEASHRNAQRDALIKKASEALAKCSEQGVSRANAFLKKAINRLYPCDPEDRYKEEVVYEIAHTIDIIGASQQQLVDWIKRGEDIKKMKDVLYEKLRPSLRKETVVDDTPGGFGAWSTTSYHYPAEIQESLKPLEEAEKASGTPEERSLGIAQALRDVAQKNNIELPLFPQWAGGPEVASVAVSSKKSFLYKNPLAIGFCAGGVLLGASILTSALSYDSNNPPVDENGNVISRKAYVWQQLKSFNPKKVQFWLNVGALAAVVTGIGVKFAASQTPVAS